MEHPNELRCECGKLLVKVTKEGYEIKCSRCKRTHFLPFKAKP